jgi:hypothetical protein
MVFHLNFLLARSAGRNSNWFPCSSKTRLRGLAESTSPSTASTASTVSTVSTLSSALFGRGISTRKMVSFLGIAERESAHDQGGQARITTVPSSGELTLDFVLGSDDHKGEFRIPNHNALQPDSIHTARPHDFNLSPVVICACEKASVVVCIDDIVPVAGWLQAQHFLHVAYPQPVQAFVNSIFTLVLLELVHAEDSLLLRGERSRLLFAEEVFLLSQADMAAEGAIVGTGGWGGGAKQKRLLPNFCGEELRGSCRRVGACEEDVRGVCGCRGVRLTCWCGCHGFCGVMHPGRRAS